MELNRPFAEFLEFYRLIHPFDPRVSCYTMAEVFYNDYTLITTNHEGNR
jgi:hypothetical protein